MFRYVNIYDQLLNINKSIADMEGNQIRKKLSIFKPNFYLLKWHKIEVEIPDQEFIKQIKIEGRKLCLLKHQDELFVVQNTCPHAGGILSDGWCKNGHLICPIHRWEYNLQTGRGAEGQGDYIEKYPIEIREDGIYVGFRESWIKKIFGK